MQDLPGALDDAAVAEGLGLSEIKNRDWAIFKTSAVKGDGLFEGTEAIHLTCMYLTNIFPCGLLLLAVVLLLIEVWCLMLCIRLPASLLLCSLKSWSPP